MPKISLGLNDISSTETGVFIQYFVLGPRGRAQNTPYSKEDQESGQRASMSPVEYEPQRLIREDIRLLQQELLLFYQLL